MTPETLEQKTDEKQEARAFNNNKVVIARCHYCGETLQIPKNITLEKDKQYDGFYISPCGSPYCNKNLCFQLFTEN